MGTGYHGGFGKTQGAIDEELAALIAELEKNGVKFTKENILFITKNKTGQIVWLETGNSGLVLNIYYTVMVNRKIRPSYERIYDYIGTHYVLCGVGTNGFISSAYPIRKK